MRFHYKLAVNIPNSLNMHIFVSTNKQTDKHTERQSNHSPLAAHACTQGKGKKKLVTIAYCMISQLSVKSYAARVSRNVCEAAEGAEDQPR